MHRYYCEIRQLIKLSMPIFVTQFSQILVSVVDSVMAGNVSTTDQAAVATAGFIWLSAILFGQGLLQALTAIIGQLHGAGTQQDIKHQLYQGFWLALLISLPLMGMLYHSHWLLQALPGVDQRVADLSLRYLRIMVYGVPAYLLYLVLRCLCESLSKMLPPMLASLIGLIINIPINAIFIEGKFGAPALGGVGCGVATVIVLWLLLLLLLCYVITQSKSWGYQLFPHWEWPKLSTIGQLLRLGTPIAFSYFFEVTLFTLAPLFMIVPLGKQWIAGHQLAMNVSSAVFTLPFSISIACTVLISNKLGEKSPKKARDAAYAGLVLGVVLSILTATSTVLWRHPLAILQNHVDPAVAAIASHLMLFAAIYQCFDALQVIANGVLRGYKDTFAIFIITFLAYWIIGFSSCYIFGLTDYIVPAMGASGIWCGFIIGITTAAILLLLRMVLIQRQPSYHNQ